MYKKIILFIGLFLFLGKLCLMWTKGFSIAEIQTPALIKKEHWDCSSTPPPDILDQTFTFLDMGNSCFAFLSADEKFVLKFFRYSRLYPIYERFPVYIQSVLRHYLPKMVTRIGRWKRVLTSCQIAYHELQEETGVIYLHLGETEALLPRVNLIDPLGNRHKVALDKMQFLVQQRAEMAYPYLMRLVRDGNLVGAKHAIDSIVKLIVRSPKQGILNHDINIETNFGFIDDRAVQFDVGPFQKGCDKELWDWGEKKRASHLRRFSSWLRSLSDELADYFEKEICV